MQTFGDKYPNKYFRPRTGISHFHEIEGVTGLSDRHEHEFYGKTLKTIRRGLAHYHTIEGVTSFDDGHEHLINIKTGPAVLVDGFVHTHCIEGKTSINSLHNHTLKARLSPW